MTSGLMPLWIHQHLKLHHPPHPPSHQTPYNTCLSRMLTYSKIRRHYHHPEAMINAIPLTPEATPINCRPYHYSPQHKDEIEK